LNKRNGHLLRCPKCGAPLNALLDTHVAFRVRPRRDGYSLGASRTPVAVLRAHLLREHGDGRLLEPDEDGIVVTCESCDYISTLTRDGMEDEDDRRAAHSAQVAKSRETPSDI
jgi:hypothetical protein